MSEAVRPRPVIAAGAVLLLAAIFLLPARADLLKPVIPMEEGSVLVYPEQVLQGAIPNKDFETMYGPGNLWLLAGVYKVFGVSVRTERVVGMVYRFLLVMALALIGRRYGGWRTGVACGVIAIVMTVGSWAVAYAWFGGLALATWSLWALTTKKWVLAAGVLGGLALGFRLDLILAIGALLVMSRRWRFMVGILVGLLPYGIHLALAGPVAVFDGLVVDPLLRINPGRRFPIPWESPLLWLVLGATAILIAAGSIAKKRAHDDRLFTCALFSIGLLPYALQRADAFHLASAGCVAVALLPAATRELVTEERRSLVVWLSCLSVVLLSWGTAVRGTVESLGQSFGVGPPVSYRLEFGGRSVPLPLEEQVGQLTGLLTTVEGSVRPGDRVFVGPDDLSHPVYNDTFLYYLVPNLTPASYFLEMNPGTADRPGSRLGRDVDSADVLILTSRYDDWDGPVGDGHSTLATPSGFCPLSTFGAWRLLRACGAS